MTFPILHFMVSFGTTQLAFSSNIFQRPIFEHQELSATAFAPNIHKLCQQNK